MKSKKVVRLHLNKFLLIGIFSITLISVLGMDVVYSEQDNFFEIVPFVDSTVLQTSSATDGSTTFDGVLYDRDDNPLPNLKVELHHRNFDRLMDFTDQDGFFSFLAHPEKYRLEIEEGYNIHYPSLPEYFVYSTNVNLTTNTTQNFNLPNIFLDVTVLDFDGNPVSGSSLTAVSFTENSISEPEIQSRFSFTEFGLTNDSGNSRLTLFPSSSVRLAVNPPVNAGFFPFTVNMPVKQDSEITLQPPHPIKFEGTVNYRDGDPIPNLHVNLGGLMVEAVTRTDNLGKYFLDASPDDYFFHVKNPEHFNDPNLPKYFSFLSDKRERFSTDTILDLTLPNYSLDVTVLDFEGNSVSGSSLSVSGSSVGPTTLGSNIKFNYSFRDGDTSDSSGKARLALFPSPWMRFEITPPEGSGLNPLTLKKQSVNADKKMTIVLGSNEVPNSGTILSFEKENVIVSSSTTVTSGSPVTLDIFQLNEGNIPLTSPSLTTYTSLCTPELVAGDLNSNKVLDPKEQWHYTCSFTPAHSGSHRISFNEIAYGLNGYPIIWSGGPSPKITAFVNVLPIDSPSDKYTELQSTLTSKGTLGLDLYFNEIFADQSTPFEINFINPQTKKIQNHIDWWYSISKDGEKVFGPTPLSHSSSGSLKNLKYTFSEPGTYSIDFGIEGILFQPIPLEIASFDLIVKDQLIYDGESVHVIVPQGSSVPGCEKNSTCFIPFYLQVYQGSTVVWSNDDSAAHTVTSGSAVDGPSHVFDSSLFMAGTTFANTFNNVGTFEYFCMVHPWMNGIVAVVEKPPKESSGGNEWDTRPTFGKSHETDNMLIVENGFTFNENQFTLTENHHTDFDQQSILVGTTNSFSAKVYADKKLKVQEFLFGIPNVGESHLAELGVEVWYDNDGNIEDLRVNQKSNVIDETSLVVSHDKTKCTSSDIEPKCDTTKVSMTFLEPLKDNVMAIKAIDFKNRDQRTYLNDGFEISGESLNPMKTKMIPSTIKNEGLLKVTQVEKYSPYWITEDGRTFEMNSFGSFKQIDQKFERFSDSGNAFTRMHSNFDKIVNYEQKRAQDVFDSTKLISELPDSFGYHFETNERMNDKMKQEMSKQENIAKKILDRMDRQTRNY